MSIADFKCRLCSDGRTAEYSMRDVPGLEGKCYDLVRCTTCGFIAVHPVPSDEELHAFYSRGYEGLCKSGIIEGENAIQANRAVIEDGITRLRSMEKLARGRPGPRLRTPDLDNWLIGPFVCVSRLWKRVCGNFA